MFQSHLGSISTDLPPTIAHAMIGFNPTLVRLAQALEHFDPTRYVGFNPTLVRLAPRDLDKLASRVEVSIPPWFD